MAGSNRQKTRRGFVRSAASAFACGAIDPWNSQGGLEMVGDSVLELRQYTLRAGQRETLIALYEREFMTSLKEAGCCVRGAFRDLDDPDRFVWIRGFADMLSQKRALQAFYGGPVWQGHKAAANATMVDSDNVLLLRPVESCE
jgi:quinol monooxygenase YgiN